MELATQLASPLLAFAFQLEANELSKETTA